MEIIFSEHALLQMQERKITKQQVLRCIRKPTKIISQTGNRDKYLKLLNKSARLYLLVTVGEQGGKNSVVIITAFITSKITKYL